MLKKSKNKGAPEEGKAKSKSEERRFAVQKPKPSSVPAGKFVCPRCKWKRKDSDRGEGGLCKACTEAVKAAKAAEAKVDRAAELRKELKELEGK